MKSAVSSLSMDPSSPDAFRANFSRNSFHPKSYQMKNVFHQYLKNQMLWNFVVALNLMMNLMIVVAIACVTK